MKILSLFIVLSSIGQLYAQNNFVVNGNTLINNTGSVSYSMGQINHLNIETTTAMISEGVLQPIETIEQVGLSIIGFHNNFSIYPNPANSKVYIQLNDQSETPVILTITDVSGRVLESKELNTRFSEFTVQQLPSALYYITITSKLQSTTIPLIKN